MTMVVLDTSILVALTNPTHYQFEEVTKSVKAFNGMMLGISVPTQIYHEFYVVLTRPKQSNGLGLNPLLALSKLEQFEKHFTRLPETDEIFVAWRALLAQYQVRGKPAHDARIVAAMQTHGLRRLYTLNPRDFQRYGDLLELV